MKVCERVRRCCDASSPRPLTTTAVMTEIRISSATRRANMMKLRGDQSVGPGGQSVGKEAARLLSMHVVEQQSIIIPEMCCSDSSVDPPAVTAV